MSEQAEPLFTFAIITDTHIRPDGLDESSPFPVNELANDRARFAIAAIAAEDPAFVLHLGDMVHPLPHLPTYKAACDEAHEIFAPVREKMHFMPGNHDIGDKPNPDAPAGPADEETIAQYEAEFGPQYYEFEYKDCVFFILNSSLVNSETPHEEAQKAWLEKALAKYEGRRLFVCTHYPPFIYSPDEQSHYDNYAEPGRSWLIELIDRYEVEAVLSGHVHQFFFNRIGGTRLYCLPPTSFIRQDYAEMYAIEPPKEYGRNDEGKFVYTLVDVFEAGHQLRTVPTDGAGLARGEALSADRMQWNGASSTPLTVPLRHAWATPIDLPFNGPMEEFARKRTRNDYTLMRLKQMGLSRVRVPLTDLMDPQIRGRVSDYGDAGIRFAFFSIGMPSQRAVEVIQVHKDLVDQLEVVSGSDNLSDIASCLEQLEKLKAVPILVGKSHSSKHEPKQGSKFAHSVSSGFKWERRETVVDALDRTDLRGVVSGLVFQVNLSDNLAGRLAEMETFARSHRLMIDANIRLADPNPAIANFDDKLIKERVAEAVAIASGLEVVRLHLDTFVDVDRGYNPRHGLLDRHYNFRPAGRALATV